MSAFFNDWLTRRMMAAAIGGGATPVLYENLICDGTAYINTNYYLPENCVILARIGDETRKASQCIYGAGYADGTAGVTGAVMTTETTTSARKIAAYYDSAASLETINVKFSYPQYDLFQTQNRIGTGSSAQSAWKGSVRPTAPLQIFNGVLSGVDYPPFSGKLRDGLFIFGSEANNSSEDGIINKIPVASFVPCTYNEQAGLWYVEENRFLGNAAGSGAFSVNTPIPLEPLTLKYYWDGSDAITDGHWWDRIHNYAMYMTGSAPHQDNAYTVDKNNNFKSNTLNDSTNGLDLGRYWYVEVDFEIVSFGASNPVYLFDFGSLTSASHAFGCYIAADGLSIGQNYKPFANNVKYDVTATLDSAITVGTRHTVKVGCEMKSYAADIQYIDLDGTKYYASQSHYSTRFIKNFNQSTGFFGRGYLSSYSDGSAKIYSIKIYGSSS